MNIAITYIMICFSVFFVSSPNHEAITPLPDRITLITKESQFIATDSIILEFQTESNASPLLYCSGNYGSNVLAPKREDNILIYVFPSSISRQAGLVNWTLINSGSPTKGSFVIQAEQSVSEIESYLGPPSLFAGGVNKSMLIIIPKDRFGNPIPDGNQVLIKNQFKSKLEIDSVGTKNLIAYMPFYAPLNTGRWLISSEAQGITSKENTLEIQPSFPIDFTISSSRNHPYADGNQLVTFSTSEISDLYGNLVSDGTFVRFIITQENGTILKASGTTINGQASTQILHPDKATSWVVRAFVLGMAQSNDVSLVFEQALKPFDVSFSESGREITVGMLKSFMDQIIPDGLDISLTILKNDHVEGIYNESSRKGYVKFNIPKDQVSSGTYKFKIEAAGLERTYINVQIW